MSTIKEITPVNPGFDFSRVPSWYVLCTNDQCPLKADCLRHLAGSNAPADLERALSVMPKALHDGHCRWFDKITTEVRAAGFSHLYDRVLKKDYTTMRKAITRYLSGCRYYYTYKRGDRSLSPEQQAWLRNYVKSRGYDWEVEFDRFFEDYAYHYQPTDR